MSKSAVAKASTIVYFGPSDTLYCRVGSIDANETVEVHARELNYYYITYTAGSTKKRGFVPVGSFVNEIGLPTAAMFNSGCLGVCTAPGKTPVYYGPNSSGFASVGTISHSETFTVFYQRSTIGTILNTQQVVGRSADLFQLALCETLKEYWPVQIPPKVCTPVPKQVMLCWVVYRNMNIVCLWPMV